MAAERAHPVPSAARRRPRLVSPVARAGGISPLYLPYISLHLPYISPRSPLSLPWPAQVAYLPYISPISPLYLPIPPWPAQVAELQLSSGDMYEWGLMHKLLVSYTRLVQRTVTDLVPKAITHRLVDTALHKLRHLAAPPPRVASSAREQVTPPRVASPPPPRRHPHFAHAEAQRVCTCSGTCYMRMRMRM